MRASWRVDSSPLRTRRPIPRSPGTEPLHSGNHSSRLAWGFAILRRPTVLPDVPGESDGFCGQARRESELRNVGCLRRAPSRPAITAVGRLKAAELVVRGRALLVITDRDVKHPARPAAQCGLVLLTSRPVITRAARPRTTNSAAFSRPTAVIAGRDGARRRHPTFLSSLSRRACPQNPSLSPGPSGHSHAATIGRMLLTNGL